jgi:hypothetical protein
MYIDSTNADEGSSSSSAQKEVTTEDAILSSAKASLDKNSDDEEKDVVPLTPVAKIQNLISTDIHVGWPGNVMQSICFVVSSV